MFPPVSDVCRRTEPAAAVAVGGSSTQAGAREREGCAALRVQGEGVLFYREKRGVPDRLPAFAWRCDRGPRRGGRLRLVPWAHLEIRAREGSAHAGV